MRRLTKFGLVLIAGSLVLNTLTLTAAMAAAEDYYLSGDGVPVASLTSVAPPDIALPDYDSWRDANPGIRLKKGGSGSTETDPAKFQQWQIDVSGATLSVTNLTIWAMAPTGASGGQFTAYLMRCSLSCVVITSTTKPVGQGQKWKRVTVTFSALTDTYAAGERLVVKLIVTSASSDDLYFAYGTEDYAAALKVNVATPPTTTTTTTTTLTTTTTTTTLPSSTTTTTPGVTTTSPTGGGVTTTVGGSSTTTLAQADSTSDQPGSEPATGSTTTLASSPNATPIAPGDPGAEMIVEASDAGVTDDVFGATHRLSPQQGLAVTFLSAAEAFRSQFLASTGLGMVGAILVVFGMRRKGDEDEN